ncbi:M56 family metallopeptidase [Phenylobacterium sp.]|uniref:M56 family metallopeptidase n=1 Tax=Phenylobacterium sp. TaxID=1871053 RepID=UPI002ED847F8
MTSDLLTLILRANLVAAAAILVALALRPAVTRRFGARTTYALWALVPLAVLASLIPGRRVVVEAGSSTVGAPIAEQAQAAAPAAPEAMVPDVLAAPAFDPEPWLLGLWVVGAAASLAVLVFRQARFRRSLGALTPEGGRYRAEAAGVGPAVVGAIFPRIIVPADFEDRFAPEERRVVLAHEEVHYRRGDALVNAVVAVARCLCWFNPLAHVAAHYVRLDQELACDAEVIGRFPAARRTYAEAMLKTQLAPMAGPLACYWPGRSAHPMKRRIALLKAPTPTAARRAAGLAAVAGLSLGAGVAAWAAQPVRIETASPPPRAITPLAYAPGVEADLKGRYSPRQLGVQLVEAIGEGYPDAIRGLVKAGADVNALAPGDGTPLVQAARLGDVATARILLENGADVNKAAPGDGNPLITAAAHGRLEMARLLVERGADVNAFVFHDETPLINAARGGKVDLVRYLLDRGADPNLTVPSGNRPGEMRSPLSMAANPAIAEILRSRGARR